MLKAALETLKIHSFMFSGIRGIGKTTLARILAKSIVCETKNICQKCSACKNPIDILELDGATYNGVEKIREIIDQSTFKPMISKRKVFIIDEAHMLSKSAFNALLKTIEEPTNSSYFIFATTEIDRIPKTVISRCLVCNLQPILKNDLCKYIKSLVNCDEDVISIVADYSNGSIREAKFAIEKLFLVNENKNFTMSDIKEVFGIIPNDIEQIIRSISSANYEKANKIIDLINAEPIFIMKEIANGIYKSDMSQENKISNYNIAINTIPLLKHFNHIQTVKVAIMKMCLYCDIADQLVEKAKELFPSLEFVR